MPSVDVVIPCYKYAHYLDGCVQSVLRQRGVDVRVLIIDDCSPDETPEIGGQLAQSDARIEYRRHPVNQGHIATYNEGLLEWAGGDYCVLLSADDMLTPGALARAVGLLDAHPDVVFAYGAEIRTATPRFADAPDPADYAWRILAGSEFWHACTGRARNIVPTPTAVVRTAVQKRVGGYRVDLPHSGDLEMWLRLAAHGSVGFVDAPQAFYRRHESNMSHGFVDLKDVRQKKAAFDVVARTCGDLVPGAAAMLATADRAMAEHAFWIGSQCFDTRDRAGVRESLGFAASTCPAVCAWGPWRRFQLKRLIGPVAWAALRPLVNRALRGRTTSSAPSLI